jgi:SAM-dependent methyltransferase
MSVAFHAEPVEDHLSFYTRWNAFSGRYFEWQFSQFETYLGRRVADLGCGVGNLTPFMLDRDLYLGIDSDPKMISFMKSKYPSSRYPNIEIFQSNILSCDCSNLIKDKKIDTILSINVLEHIENDNAALQLMLESLPKGGSLCLLVPAFSQLYGTLDALDNHYRRYDKALLLSKLAKFDLEIIKLRYFNLIGAIGWFTKGKVLNQTKHTNDNFIIMNSLSSIMKRIEDSIDIPFGLSLIVVASLFNH